MNRPIKALFVAACWGLLCPLGNARKKANKCPLPCANKGVCKEGLAPVATPTNSSSSPEASETIGSTSRRNYYCHCPAGYSGSLCQIKFRDCPVTTGRLANQTKCANGALCQRDISSDSVAYYHCECDDTVTDYSTAAARRICQHAGTVFCTDYDLNHGSLGQASGAYCRNGGTCVTPVTEPGTGKHHHDGCNCPAGTWKGAHCEILADDSLAAKYHYYDSDQEEVPVGAAAPQNNVDTVYRRPLWRRMVLWTCALIVITMVGGMAYLVYDTQRQNSYNRRRRTERAARIPRNITGRRGASRGKRKNKKASNKKPSRQEGGPRFEPLEIEEPAPPPAEDEYRDEYRD